MKNDTPLHKIELLAPAGNMEKLEVALHYGADAVYLAGKQFSLRNFSANFSLSEIKTAIEMVHNHHARAYIAVNTFARNEDLNAIELFLQALAPLSIDGIIVADPAVVALCRRILPRIAIHLSTQANATNAAAARFWLEQGVRRINLARELSLSEIRAIVQTCPGLEFETFVHGAMCMSYSGRCLLSNFLAHRPSNQGMCCQPCRFKYAVVEETRPGQYFPISEDDSGTYLFNSHDLCMIEHLPALIQSGIRALKIEGRMKGIHYAATAVKTYREAIDSYYADPSHFHVLPYWLEELNKITSRGYCTGFYLDAPDQTTSCYHAPAPSKYPLAAKVLTSAGQCKADIEVRNQIRIGDAVEIVQPVGPPILDIIEQLTDSHGDVVPIAQPGSQVTIRFSTAKCRYLDLIRLRTEDRHCAA